MPRLEAIEATSHDWLRGRLSLRDRWWGFFWRRCGAGLPWFWPARPRGHPAMVAARRMARWDFGRDHNPVSRKLAQVLVTIAWPLAVLRNLWLVRLWFVPRQAFRKRIPGALWASIRNNILPSEYYAYRLWQTDRRKNIDNYFYTNDAFRLFKILNRPSQINPIVDKLAFYELCKIHGVPTPEVLAVFAPAAELMNFRSGLPPQHDLFVKIRNGQGGLGAERFQWNCSFFENSRGCRLKPEELCDYLADRARREKVTLLVQPALSNHPDLRLDSNDALATARLVTGRSFQGEVTPIFCFISFGLPDQITNSGSTCVTLVEVEDGQYMPPPRDNSVCQYRQFGSDSVPDWGAALRHVKAAHNACSNFVFVGWDVAFTSDGPVILEGNTNWSADTYQALRGEPLGLTKFADILATHLGQNAPKLSDH